MEAVLAPVAEDDPTAVGRRIAQARREAHISSQQELADRLGVSLRSVQLYEAGTVIPYKHFGKLEDITGRSTAWFLYGEREQGSDLAQVALSIDVLRATLESQVSEILDRIRAIEERMATLDGQRMMMRELSHIIVVLSRDGS